MSCAEHERWWVNPDTGIGRCVDRNLADDWLEKLNSLKTLRLTSVCEGHLGANDFNQKDHPILRFRMKDGYARILKIIRSAESEAVSATIHTSIEHPGTQVRCGWHGVEPNTFFVDLDSKQHRQATDLEPWVSEWFEKVIHGLQIADAAILQRLTV